MTTKEELYKELKPEINEIVNVLFEVSAKLLEKMGIFFHMELYYLKKEKSN